MHSSEQMRKVYTNRDPWWKINSFLSEVTVCWSCMEKITIKMERAFSIILRALLVTHHNFQQSLQLPALATASNSCRSFQQSLQPSAVAVTSGNSPAFIYKCQTGKLFPIHRRLSPVTAWYNYIIIATFEGVETAIMVETTTRVETAIISLWRSTSSVFWKLFQAVSNCFKFKLFHIVITSGQQPACHPMMVISLINKVGDQFNN